MENPNTQSQSLHHCQVHQLRSFLNITYAVFYLLALIAILYYRGSFFFYTNETKKKYMLIILLAAELIYTFLWIIKQPIYWRPVTWTAFPENLPKDEELPRIDVLICTADPNKEPTFEVMNTVISAMCLDYPADKLHVYLSDDGGASVTLDGMKEAWVFATWWLPFCKKYNTKPTCPQAYFEKPEKESLATKEFLRHKMIVQEKYETFKQRLQTKKISKGELDDNKTSPRNHPALVQVINEDSIEDDVTNLNPEAVAMPFLVYVAREKRPSRPHNFKAGALNALLRVSNLLSNSPYVLILDCDMYCNDSISARQAMCFYLDPEISSKLSWVLFPQKFHNTTESDIYDSQMKVTWPVYWPGANGLQGSCISGTNVYMKRTALYDIDIDKGVNLDELRQSFGPSNELIKSLSRNDMPNASKGRDISSALLQEAHFLASCNYEQGTNWGHKVGYWYGCLVEDILTSLMLHSRGWTSVYLNPPRPQFLGSATTTLNELLVQGMRWYGGLSSLSLSKYCPLFGRLTRMHILQKMYYAWLLFWAYDFIPVICFAIIPPLCFLYGIPLYPKLSDPFFVAYAFVFVSSQLKHLSDIVLICGGTWRTWLNEQRMWMTKCLTCYFFGFLECVMAKLGLVEATFNPTNKAGGNDTANWYELGIYDFRTSNLFLIPLVTATIFNISCFVGGVARLLTVTTNWDAMFAQMLLSFYALIMSLPVIEAITLRKDKASIPLPVTMVSSLISLALLSLGYLIFMH